MNNPSPDTPIPSELVELLRKHACHSLPRVGIYDTCRQAASLILTQKANIKELEGRIAATIRVIEDGFDRKVDGPFDKCEHGQLGVEDCIGCYDESLLSVLSSNMRGAK